MRFHFMLVLMRRESERKSYGMVATCNIVREYVVTFNWGSIPVSKIL